MQGELLRFFLTILTTKIISGKLRKAIADVAEAFPVSTGLPFKRECEVALRLQREVGIGLEPEFA